MIPAAFRALPRTSLAEGVADQIRGAILRAELPEGAPRDAAASAP